MFVDPNRHFVEEDVQFGRHERSTADLREHLHIVIFEHRKLLSHAFDSHTPVTVQTQCRNSRNDSGKGLNEPDQLMNDDVSMRF